MLRNLTLLVTRRIYPSTRPALRLESTAARPVLTSCWKCGKHLCGPSPTCASPAQSKLRLVGNGSRGSPAPAHANEGYPQQQTQQEDVGCGAVQPLAVWATFFDAFALTRTHFDVDLGALKQRFLSLQQVVHPDANSLRSEVTSDFASHWRPLDLLHIMQAQKEREFSEKQS
ncbi:hypothetical protein BC830DRAFT_1172131, partial [Chytriomyces sp. MP71]